MSLRTQKPQLAVGKSDLDLSIAVLGLKDVGKSTLIRLALDLPSCDDRQLKSQLMNLHGKSYIITLHELSYKSFQLVESDVECRRQMINQETLVCVDGALVLYDVTNRESLALIPNLIRVLNVLDMPLAVVACKCDKSTATAEIMPSTNQQQVNKTSSRFQVFSVHYEQKEAYKTCLESVVLAILTKKANEPILSYAEQYRSPSNADTVISSSTSFLYMFESKQPELGEINLDVQLGVDTLSVGYDREIQFPSLYPLGQQKLSYESASNQSSYERRNDLIVSSIISVRSYNYGPKICPDGSHGGFTSQQLVGRLLSSVLSTKDLKYVKIFLTLYRFFLSPFGLLEAIAQAFSGVKCSGWDDIISAVQQLRYLAVFEMWMKAYPGDFALLPTYRKARDFIEQLRMSRILSVGANELSLRIINVVEDDNTYWAFNDGPKILNSKAHRMRVDASIDSVPADLMQNNINSDYDLSYSHSSPSEKKPMIEAILDGKGADQETYHERLHMNQHLTSEQQSEFSKSRWRQLVSESEENIAREITRIDWVMFSSVNPRDLIRHVTLPPDARKYYRYLGNVDRMIDHFNHIAYWVANIILIRDKAKHRAIMMMKLMKVARKLRELNNYNSLGALLAGMNSTAIHRLHATRGLISPVVLKDFMKLEILMSTQRSHSAYRLAWKNTHNERIPFLPLHRRDLMSVADSSKTFLDERCTLVNWRKFEIMGEMVIDLQNVLDKPHNLISVNGNLRALILDMKIVKDDDILFDRSTKLEPSGNIERKKFSWFQK